MYDKIVIENDSMGWYDYNVERRSIQVTDSLKDPGEGVFVKIFAPKYGTQLEHLLGKRLRVTIEIIDDNTN
jgi:hypothetical protein